VSRGIESLWADTPRFHAVSSGIGPLARHALPTRPSFRSTRYPLLTRIPKAYFVVTAPTKGTQWVNGQTNVISWEKGLLDGIEGYDIELTRLSADGLILVAKNGACSTFRAGRWHEADGPSCMFLALFCWTFSFALDSIYDVHGLFLDGFHLDIRMTVPAKPAGLNLYIENVPPGNDYFVIFINSTHGELRGTSQQFEILPAGRTSLLSLSRVQFTLGYRLTCFFALQEHHLRHKQQRPFRKLRL